MSEVAEYRRYAQMCVENAETAPSEGDRRTFLSLAGHWLKLASEAEGRQPATPDTLASVDPVITRDLMAGNKLHNDPARDKGQPSPVGLPGK
jgi:hypothetical protein